MGDHTHTLDPHEKKRKDDDVYAWFCRVRRDILALQLIAKQKHPDDWAELLGEWPMRADQSAEDARKDAEEILKAMGKPADPGDPPVGPFD